MCMDTGILATLHLHLIFPLRQSLAQILVIQDRPEFGFCLYSRFSPLSREGRLEGDLSSDPFWHLLCRTSHTQSLEYWNSFTELQAKWDIYLVLVESGYVSPLWGTRLLRQNAVQFLGSISTRTFQQLEMQSNKGCVTLWPLPFTVKSILVQKKNYENSNISPCKNIIFKKIL